jgi:hypothetical protein
VSWAEEIVAVLLDCKREGFEFDVAWKHALLAHPARRGRDRGPERPTLLDEPAESLVDFTRRVCRDAWYGHGSSVGRFGVDMLGAVAERDESVVRGATHASAPHGARLAS